MIDSSRINIESLVVHKIGSKSLGEEPQFSKNPFRLQDEEGINAVLKTYFFSSFKKEEYFNFIGAEQDAAGLVFQKASEIFDNPESLHQASMDIGAFLYEQSNHPNIRPGELYVAVFRDCVVDGEVVDGLGIFKSETKETFLKVFLKEQNFELGVQEGINIKKLDKGCIIFNTEREFGYKVLVVDNINKKDEAQFWVKDFLALQPREDSYYFTQNYMDVCKGFVKDVYNSENNVEKTEQFDFMNRSLDFFENKRSFAQDDFEREVIRYPDVSEAFADYKTQFEEDYGVPLTEEFDISKNAVKNEKKYFKSVLKLDKNFHVYVHGRREFIEKGFDGERGLHYYKLFFEYET